MRAWSGSSRACLLTFRDEVRMLILPAAAAREPVAAAAVLFEEFLAREAEEGRLALPLKPVGSRAVLHGHCHQKTFRAMAPVEKVLALVPGLKTELIESSCCGMAGAFGYQAETIDTSIAMAELSLLPAVRAAADAVVIADGTSCRHQIHDGTRREALHVARVLAASLDGVPLSAMIGSEPAVA